MLLTVELSPLSKKIAFGRYACSPLVVVGFQQSTSGTLQVGLEQKSYLKEGILFAENAGGRSLKSRFSTSAPSGPAEFLPRRQPLK